MKQPQTPFTIYHRGNFTLGKVFLIALSSFGIVLLIWGIRFWLTTPFQTLPDSNQYASEFFLIIPGTLFTPALFPALYFSGIRIDPRRKRLKFFNGFLGRRTRPWINLDSTNYLGVVYSSEIRSGGALGAAQPISLSVVKIYLHSDERHMELYTNFEPKANKALNLLSSRLELPVSDSRKKQDVPGMKHGRIRQF